MKQVDDKIEFESKREIEELMKVVDKYVGQNPDEKDNQILKQFFTILDYMDMVW